MEAPAAETPADETALEEAPAVEAAAPDEAAPAEVAEEPVLEELPVEEPVIQLVDAEGEALDMVSQESADLLASGDPYWEAGDQYYSSVSNPALCYPRHQRGSGNLLYQRHSHPECHQSHRRRDGTLTG